MNGGYFVVLLNGNDRFSTPSNRTGNQRLSKIENHLRKSKVEFVEDFESASLVVVRYGDLVHDAIWDMYDDREQIEVKA